MNKRIIIDISRLNECELPAWLKNKLINVLKTFLGNFWLQSNAEEKELTFDKIFISLYASFDSQLRWGDNVAAYLLSKLYFDNYETIDVSALLIHYFSYLLYAANSKMFEQICERNDDKKLKEFKKFSSEDIAKIIEHKLQIKLNDEQANYVFSFLNDINLTLPSPPFKKNDENVVFYYNKLQHFDLILQTLLTTKSFLLKNVKANEENHSNKEKDIKALLEKAKKMNVW